MSAFGMLLQGKVGDAIVRVIETILGITLPKPLADIIHKFTSDGGKILMNALIALGADFFAGKSVPDAADDALAVLATQGISAAKTDVMDAIRLMQTSATPLSTVTVTPPIPTDPVPGTVPEVQPAT